jgi:hypothetical protein
MSKEIMNKELNYISSTIENLKIDSNKKLILQARFLYLLEKYKSKVKYYLIFYDTGRLFVTVGSISIPALLSIENYIDKITAFWLIWSISLFVSLINGYITLYKLDKKYFSTITTIEKLSCEFWQYVSLCGKYSGAYGHIIPSHENQFIFFANNIERIQIKNIEEIYIKLVDNSNAQEDKNLIPSISEESYEISKNLKNDIQQKSKVLKVDELNSQLKNIIVS